LRAPRDPLSLDDAQEYRRLWVDAPLERDL